MKRWIYCTCTAASLVAALTWTVHLATKALSLEQKAPDLVQEPAQLSNASPKPMQPAVIGEAGYRLLVSCEEAVEGTIFLQDARGNDTGSAILTAGQGVTAPLPAGNYQLSWKGETVSFAFSEEAVVSDVKGPAWSDGEILHLGTESYGAVTIRCPDTPWPTAYYYDLEGADFVRTLTVYYDPETDAPGEATAWGLPLGDYRILENGEERASVTLTDKVPCLSVDGIQWPAAPVR